jgi:hypothetical protein
VDYIGYWKRVYCVGFINSMLYYMVSANKCQQYLYGHLLIIWPFITTSYFLLQMHTLQCVCMNCNLYACIHLYCDHTQCICSTALKVLKMASYAILKQKNPETKANKLAFIIKKKTKILTE